MEYSLILARVLMLPFLVGRSSTLFMYFPILYRKNLGNFL